MSVPVTDIHMHVVPGVDDGSRDIDESCGMLRLAVGQGVDAVFATPHDSAFSDKNRVRESFGRLKEAVRALGLPIALYLGCEMRVYPETAELCLRKLNDGVLPTMGDSRCVLTEFDFANSSRDYLFCADTLIKGGYIPIIAHVERYPNTDVRLAGKLKDAGALIQINAYSIAGEKDARIRRTANMLLEARLVDFIGTDAHGAVRRPPDLGGGMDAFRRLYGEEYAKLVAFDNPRKYLL
ncbi:MAG: hypothetical protein IJM45_08030 [Clostridia bacterium]|nr:hypothetical protein [Clostridia bacterium]